MTVEKDAKLNGTKCLYVCKSVCEIREYWAAYAAKKYPPKLNRDTLDALFFF